MTIKQLEYFSEVARSLNFSKAAEHLFISQSALSRSILSLEEEIGAVLLSRDKHSVSLTPAGAALAARLPKLSVELTEIIAETQQAHHGDLGSMRIAFQNGLVLPSPILEVIHEFTEPHSRADIMPVCLDADEIQDSLLQEKIEISYTCEDLTPPGMMFNSINLRSDPACIACHQDRFGIRGSTLADYRITNFIFSGTESSLSVTRFKDMCQSRGFYPRITQVKDSSTLFFCVENGLGVGIFPEHHKIFESKSICRIQLQDVPPFMCSLQWSVKTANPLIGLFVNAVRAKLGGLKTP
jgi:DNA-binding transcriptional LysR family regulator